MEDNYSLQNTPLEGTPEHDEYMRNQFGDDYELGYRVGFGRRFGAYILSWLNSKSKFFSIAMFKHSSNVRVEPGPDI